MKNKAKELPASLYARIIRLIELGKSTTEIVDTLNKDPRIGATKERLWATLPLLSQKNKRQVSKHLSINDALYASEKKVKLAKAKAEAEAQQESQAKAEAETKAEARKEAIAKARAKEEAKAKAKAEAEAAASVASLEAEELELSEKQSRLEDCYKINAKRWHELHSMLKEEANRLLEMKKEISVTEERVRRTAGEIKTLQRTMNDAIKEAEPITKRLNDVRETLSSIRDSRKKVLIFVYRDKLEAYRGDGYPIELDLTGWETKRQEIFDDKSGEYIELIVWQVDVVAKIMVVKELESLKSFEDIEFVLDNDVQSLEAYL